MSSEPSQSSDAATSDAVASDEATAREPFVRSALITFLIAEAGAFIFYMVISRPMWFYVDEWDFLADRTIGDVGDLFRAHNEHWVTLPVLAYRGLWWLFGLNSYRPYQFAIVALHLTAAFLVRAVMRRVGVRPWTATIVAGVLVFLGSGYQNIVFPFQITLVGALVFGLAHLLLATHEGPFDRRDIYGLAAGLAALMCSGVGVSMVIAVGVALLLTRGWRMALVHTAPLAAIYVVWYAAIGHVGYDGYRAGLGDIVPFVQSLVAAIFRAMGQGDVAGVLLAVLLIVGLIVTWTGLGRAEFRRRAAIPIALLVGAAAMLCITALGRAGLGAFQEKSRYLHLVAAMVLPAIGVAADAVMRKSRWLIAPVIAVLLVGIPGNIDTITDYMHKGVVTNQARYKTLILSLPRSPVAKEVPRDVKPDQHLARFITIGWLLDGVAAGRIPKPGLVSEAQAAVNEVRLSFHQNREKLRDTDECSGLATPMVFDLEPGERIVVRAPNRSVRIVPATAPYDKTFPFLLVTLLGNELEAVRPVQFRLINETAPVAVACSDPATMAAARAAGAAQADAEAGR